MPRVPRTAPAPTNLIAPPEEKPGAALLDSLGPEKKKRKRRPADARKTLEAATKELDDVLAKRKAAEPRHLVALYAKMHETVYGVAPEELTRPDEQMAATSAARALVAQCFGGKYDDAIAFMRWVWQEQRRRTARRRANGETPFRVGWRLQFASRTLVTDYRAAMFEQTRRARAR